MLTTVHVTSSTVYNVISDDSISGCHHCLNLQHYLSNVTKHSNTQLHFLPGLHHLPTDLIIQNVHNISLIGSTANGATPDTVIQCVSSVGIVMTNVTNLTIRNMVIKNCEKQDSPRASVFIKECHFVTLHSVHIYHDRVVISLLGFNVLGNSYFHEITCQEMRLYYNETTVKAQNHNILIDSFHVTNHFKSEYGIYLNMSQYSYEITLQVVNTTIEQLRRSSLLWAISNSSASQNRVFIYKCRFHNSNDKTVWYLFYLENVTVNFNDCQIYYNTFSKCQALVKSVSCGNVTFINFDLKDNRLYENIFPSKKTALIQIMGISDVTIKHCQIYNSKTKVLDTSDTTVVIENTTFFLIKTAYKSTLQLQNTDLLLKGPIVFHKNRHNFGTVIKLYHSIITVHGYIEFSKNHAFSIVTFSCRGISCSMMKVLDNTTILIASNGLFTYFTDAMKFLTYRGAKFLYPQCFFQYFSTINLDDYINAGNFTILIKYNRFKNLSLIHNLYSLASLVDKDFAKMLEILAMSPDVLFPFSMATTHCYWLPQSAFNTAIPLDVNKQYIKYTNNSKLLHMNDEKTLCYCQDRKHYDCFKDELNSLYPGQTLTVSFYANVNHTLNNEIITELQTYDTACTVLNAKQNIQFIGKNCTTVEYAITFPTNNWCELLLRSQQTYNIYYIRELPCPLGFVKIDGICQCYPSFRQFGFTDCDIDTQAVLRPSKGWISCNSNGQNGSYSCEISRLCPFDYCKPSSFYLSFSTPDLQCQFDRTGLLCGQCQQGLSTMFGSHHCQHCSNIYLLLIIPIAIAGLALVLMLFFLNLTVTDGTINSFILYANIININSTMFFPDHHTIDPLRMFISLANLDLGIQTCFYNGMDDYAKVWLQLAFPFYIISIATLIIVVSRYSIAIKRLTTHRATSVLATLFLLSFTSILCTTSSALFTYSSISHLPSKHTRVVWSLDANVPLFEAKFILLFVLCIILFSLLVLFTIILLCTKTLIKFRLLHNILDSYQRPYKSYYWFGLQLSMRIFFLYISRLDVKINITISIITLSILNAVQGLQRPFKNESQDYHETLLMINLFGLYVFTLSKWWIAIEILIVIAGTQFVLIIVYHVVNHFCGEIIWKKFLHWECSDSKQEAGTVVI